MFGRKKSSLRNILNKTGPNMNLCETLERIADVFYLNTLFSVFQIVIKKGNCIKT